jgi:hypothetical protein|tara:strand:- start:3441 stop:3551 length:111 start_codon:yes stop_codon:yes gene_type:complete
MDANIEIKKLEMKNKLLERENRQLKIKLKQIQRILK